ncbi:MAG: hypothetical protein JWN31_110 [Frankiales bacterium]|nr:hypothetical protein [Frankiales bacterium]
MLGGVYTLASASILAIQLARHPNGAQLADVVDRVLALTPEETATLSRYAGQHGPYLDRLADADGLLALLELLQREHPAGAVDAALDAVVSAWLGDVPELRATWDAVLSPVPAALPETSYSEALRLLLEEVSRRSRAQWRRVVAAHAAHRGRLWWSTTMHEACLAAHQAERVREVARAQLAAARALHLSLEPDDPEFHAIAMAVTGSVQALCTDDLLDTSQLREPWLAGA